MMMSLFLCQDISSILAQGRPKYANHFFLFLRDDPTEGNNLSGFRFIKVNSGVKNRLFPMER